MRLTRRDTKDHDVCDGRRKARRVAIVAIVRAARVGHVVGEGGFAIESWAILLEMIGSCECCLGGCW